MNDIAPRADTITAKIQGLLEDHLCTEGKAPLDANLVEDLGADSLDVVELVMAAEEEFEIEISDEAAEACKTVQDMIDLVETLVAAKTRVP